jgi:hypothetical protein
MMSDKKVQTYEMHLTAWSAISKTSVRERSEVAYPRRSYSQISSKLDAGSVKWRNI